MKLVGRPALSSSAPSHPSWRRQSLAKMRGETGMVLVRQLLGGSCWQGCKWLAVGRDPRSDSRMLPPAEVPGRLEGPGAGGSRCLQATSSPPPLPSFLPHAPSLSEWCFGNISRRFSNILHSLPFPPGAAVRAGKVLAPNPAKLLLTCVLCVPQTFHSAVTSEARNPC